MARSEVTGRKPRADEVVDAFSIAEFCRRHGISVQAFYKYRSQMPVTFNVGVRRLISRESAETWRHDREAASSRRTAEAEPINT